MSAARRNLHHQHIVQVHDVGEAGGEYFIAMEYLHAETCEPSC